MDPESAESVMLIPFKYCSNLTEGEVTAIALARGITGAVCGVISFTALVILALVNCYHHRVCETAVKRLVIGNLASSVPFQLVLALHLIHYFQPEQENFCKADGFFYRLYTIGGLDYWTGLLDYWTHPKFHETPFSVRS